MQYRGTKLAWFWSRDRADSLILAFRLNAYLTPSPIKSIQREAGVSVLLASDDLDRTRRLKATPLRGRFASLDPPPPVKDWQLRGGWGESSSRRSGGRPVNGFVNVTQWDVLNQETRDGPEETGGRRMPTSATPSGIVRDV
jgi:hypothetical protein